MSFRIGIGYDVHALATGRKLILGGVHVPFPKGLVGHSDADVLIHAICDALLGAAALGDLGTHFPDSDIRFKGISSLLLLKKIAEKIRGKGFDIGNIDAVVMAQKPRLKSFVPAMQNAIAKTLGIPVERISLKATTTEGMGFVGREEGIAAQAVTLLEKTV